MSLKTLNESLEKILKEDITNEEELSDEYDNEGNRLTKQQVEFFKDSKIRDKQNRLLVCYHGTSAKFNTFNSKYSYDNFGFHFGTEKAAMDRDSTIIKKVYLNIKNPIIIEEDLQYWDAVSFMYYFLKHEELVKNFPVLMRKWEYLKSQWIENEMNSEYRDESYWNEEFGDIFRRALYRSKYDGIIYTNYGEDAGSISYMAFRPNQIKSITNKNPTNRKNINESYEPNYYRLEVADSNGKNLGGLFKSVWDIVYSRKEDSDTEEIEDLLDELMERHQQPNEWYDNVKFAFTEDFYQNNKSLINKISGILDKWNSKLIVSKVNPKDIVYKDNDQIAYTK